MPSNCARTTGSGGISDKALTCAALSELAAMKPPLTLTNSMPFVASVRAFAVEAGSVKANETAVRLHKIIVGELHSLLCKGAARQRILDDVELAASLTDLGRGWYPDLSSSRRYIPPGSRPDCA